MFEWIKTLPHWAVLTIEITLTVIVTLVIANAVARLVRKALRWDANPIPSTSIFLNLTRFAIYVIGLTVVLDLIGINASALITALGVGGIAVSLGLQDTVANFVSGLQMSLAKILVPGEYVKIGDDVGVIHDITWRSTTITARDGETIIIPNSVMNKNAVAHLPELLGVESSANFVVPHGSDLADISARIARAAEEALGNEIIKDSCVDVQFYAITGSGIEGRVIAQTKPTTKAGVACDRMVRAIMPLLTGRES